MNKTIINYYDRTHSNEPDRFSLECGKLFYSTQITKEVDEIKSLIKDINSDEIIFEQNRKGIDMKDYHCEINTEDLPLYIIKKLITEGKEVAIKKLRDCIEHIEEMCSIQSDLIEKYEYRQKMLELIKNGTQIARVYSYVDPHDGEIYHLISDKDKEILNKMKAFTDLNLNELKEYNLEIVFRSSIFFMPQILVFDTIDYEYIG